MAIVFLQYVLIWWTTLHLDKGSIWMTIGNRLMMMTMMPHVILNKKWQWRQRHDNLAVTVNDAAPWLPDDL